MNRLALFTVIAMLVTVPQALWANGRGCYVAFAIGVGHVGEREAEIAGQSIQDIFDLIYDPAFEVRAFRHRDNRQLIFHVLAKNRRSPKYQNLAERLNRFEQMHMVVGNGANGTYEQRERSQAHEGERGWRSWLRNRKERAYHREALIELSKFLEDDWVSAYTHDGITGQVRITFVLASDDLGWEFFSSLSSHGFKEVPASPD